MKRIALITSLIFTTIVFAQKNIEKTVGQFSQLKVYDLIEVELIRSDQNKVVISGENANDVLIINKNGKLKIRMKLKERFDGKETSVTLYYTSLETIDANEGATIFSNSIIKEYEVDLKTQEGGKINVVVDTKYLNIKAVTGGLVEVTGTAEQQDIYINTGGSSKTKEIETEATKVVIRAGGEAEVNAKDLVDINIRAGGDVFVYGTPKNVKENIVLGGSVNRITE